MKILSTSTVLVLLSSFASPVLAQSAAPSASPSGPTLVGHTARVSVDSLAAQANGASLGVSISANGRFVAFTSDASNLVPGDTNNLTDVFVRDRASGTTERVNLSSAGAQANGESYTPVISANGRFVAFASNAQNLVAGDVNSEEDIFLRDRLTGTTVLVSADASGVSGNDGSAYGSAPALSADGRYVAFVSYASNLVAGDTNLTGDIFVRDVLNGTTERVSVDSASMQGTLYSTEPAISADGRWVAFTSFADNLVPGDTNGHKDVFLRDRVSGVTERVSVGSTGTQGDRNSHGASITADGRFVVFASDATNLVNADTNRHTNVYLRDRANGTTTLLSYDLLGRPGNGMSYNASITPDGRYVVFQSDATDLVHRDKNFEMDVFVRDMTAGTTILASVDSAGVQGDSSSGQPSISANGRNVAFNAYASNLVPLDTNATVDIFVRTLPLSVSH